MEWKYIPGGICLYGDRRKPRKVSRLWWTVTPLTWAQLERDNPCGGDNQEPITEINLEEASEIAVRFNARLPTTVEWEWMASGHERRRYPWGDQAYSPDLANLRPAGIGCVAAADSYPDGKTPEGISGVAGNVWEWTSTRTLNNGAVIRGGSYNSIVLYAEACFLNAAPIELRSKGIGIRLVKEEE